MAPFIGPPEPNELLPPFLACLPAAFCAIRPPPALLPLLSPILRQRVQLLSNTTEPGNGSWLALLNWDNAQANELIARVESTTFEPHPVSGEIELGDVGLPLFRRKDQETLQSLLKVPDLGLMVTYLWCEQDEAGGGVGWRVTELHPFDPAAIDSNEWVDTIAKANKRLSENTPDETSGGEQPHVPDPTSDRIPSHQPTANNMDEDDYWAQYDSTPGRTPGMKGSPAPPPTMSGPSRLRTSSDAEYYARYETVQPDMDNEDPSADWGEIGESTLHGNEILLASKDEAEQQSLFDSRELGNGTAATHENSLHHTRPSSSASGDVVSRMEQSAEDQSQAEIAVKQHIGTSIKGLFRLARGAGISVSEFKRLARTELDLLDLLEET